MRKKKRLLHVLAACCLGPRRAVRGTLHLSNSCDLVGTGSFGLAWFRFFSGSGSNSLVLQNVRVGVRRIEALEWVLSWGWEWARFS